MENNNNNKDDIDHQIKAPTSTDQEINSDQIPTTFPAVPSFSSIFDTPSASCDLQNEIKTSNLGFIDMLEIQDYTPSLFDMFQTPPPPPLQPPPPPPPELASPSGNSISSLSSTEVTTSKTEERDKEEKSTINNQLKPKKKNTKKQRQPRFAFMTKSDVDHLDDGYRWRKYGQKAVKNSPYPRSYYRCTMASCGVKKRVERSCEDSTVVVTTYEGTHGHPCPVTLRTTTTAAAPETAGFIGGVNFPTVASPNFIISSQPHNYNNNNNNNQVYINNNNNNNLHNTININPISSIISDFVPHYYNFPPPSSSSTTSSSSMVRDHGLLQDMIMPRKESQEDDDHDQHH
ncbi:probable WRKY transcription factor 48 [Impatiens glandulifera]|uniref:probable WRKY transcription factor 48 n=1 Tax=Impatiens glandulifera TaxID=253017 RepID=UPI001FB0A950|nr:probable WRKY transcription factor 48 [Impatiens glandulifera]